MNDRLYNVPATVEPEKEWKEIILRSSNPRDFMQWFDSYPARLSFVKGLVLTCPSVPAASRFDLDAGLAGLETCPTGIPLEIQAWSEELPRLYLWRIMLRRFRIIVALEARKNLLKSVKEACRMGYPVEIASSSFTKKHLEELLTIVHYYFHDRALKAPIEPVHSLFRTWLRGKGADLPTLYRETPERFVYVTESGKQTVSARWERAGRFHDALSASGKCDAFKQMEGCSVCPAYRICGGAPKSPVPLGDCETVLALADLFRLEATSMAEDVRTLLS